MVEHLPCHCVVTRNIEHLMGRFFQCYPLLINISSVTFLILTEKSLLGEQYTTKAPFINSCVERRQPCDVNVPSICGIIYYYIATLK